jgi:allophanate hydrolase subunit 1
MGLDVYLGAPVATPLDPRHRLVTTKYNPARTWTPENAVGIGVPICASTAWRDPGLPVCWSHGASVEYLPANRRL